MDQKVKAVICQGQEFGGVLFHFVGCPEREFLVPQGLGHFQVLEVGNIQVVRVRTPVIAELSLVHFHEQPVLAGYLYSSRSLLALIVGETTPSSKDNVRCEVLVSYRVG